MEKGRAIESVFASYLLFARYLSQFLFISLKLINFFLSTSVNQSSSENELWLT
jgi:hypothetical protein